MAFLLGIVASLIAGAVLWGATHPADLRYLVIARQRHQHLSGTWHHYHLSRDADLGPEPLWIHHSDELNISPLGYVSGSSCSDHVKPLAYEINGHIRGSVMRCWFTSRNTQEDAAYAVYPNLLSGTQLIGALVGEDFNKHWFVSPVILDRSELSSADLARLAARFTMLAPPG